MSNSNKLNLPSKLKADFSTSTKLLEEVFDILELHDVIYMADAESHWIAIQQDKLEDFLAQRTAGGQTSISDAAKLRVAEIQESLSNAQSSYLIAAPAAQKAHHIFIDLNRDGSKADEATLDKARDRDKEAYARANESLKSMEELESALQLAQDELADPPTPKVSGAAPNFTPTVAKSNLRFDTVRTPSAFGGDLIAQNTGKLQNISTTQLRDLASQSKPDEVQIAGERIIKPSPLKLTRRLRDAKLRTHVWVHDVELQVEHPNVRGLRLGLWTLIRVALHDQPWIFDTKLIGDLAALLDDIASVTSLVEDGELELRMNDLYELTKVGHGMRAFISNFTQIAKDLRELECSLPDTYLKTHLLTIVGKDKRYTNYIRDKITGRVPAFNLAETVGLLNYFASEINDTIFLTRTVDGNLADTVQAKGVGREARKPRGDNKVDVDGKEICRDFVNNHCNRHKCRNSHKPAVAASAPGGPIIAIPPTNAAPHATDRSDKACWGEMDNTGGCTYTTCRFSHDPATIAAARAAKTARGIDGNLVEILEDDHDAFELAHPGLSQPPDVVGLCVDVLEHNELVVSTDVEACNAAWEREYQHLMEPDDVDMPLSMSPSSSKAHMETLQPPPSKLQISLSPPSSHGMFAFELPSKENLFCFDDSDSAAAHYELDQGMIFNIIFFNMLLALRVMPTCFTLLSACITTGYGIKDSLWILVPISLWSEVANVTRKSLSGSPCP